IGPALDLAGVFEKRIDSLPCGERSNGGFSLNGASLRNRPTPDHLRIGFGPVQQLMDEGFAAFARRNEMDAGLLKPAGQFRADHAAFRTPGSPIYRNHPAWPFSV